MKPALYMFVNKGLGMSAGKIAAQVAQATVGAWKTSVARSEVACLSGLEAATGYNLPREWWNGAGDHHTTYVMEAESSEHMYSIERYLNARGFKTYLMIDEGMTEIRPHTPTVLGVEIVDKDDEHVAASFMAFKLYRDKPASTIESRGGKQKRPWYLWGAR